MPTLLDPAPLVELDVVMEKLLLLFKDAPTSVVGGRGDILTTEELVGLVGSNEKAEQSFHIPTVAV
ncbi:MAG: hypothetical protein AB7H70_14595 [Rhodospirillaceae bacterium]